MRGFTAQTVVFRPEASGESEHPEALLPATVAPHGAQAQGQPVRTGATVEDGLPRENPPVESERRMLVRVSGDEDQARAEYMRWLMIQSVIRAQMLGDEPRPREFVVHPYAAVPVEGGWLVIQL